MRKQALLVIFLIIFFLFRIESQGCLKEISSDEELETLASKFIDCRDSVGLKADYLLPEPQAALRNGMVLGIRDDLPVEFRKNLTDTSTIHIVVVSGQNLTLLGGFMMLLAPLFGRKKTTILSLIAIIFYALVSGLQIPVIRAAIMVGFACVATLFGREKLNGWIILITGALMLIYNPNWLLNLSFQLSFLATIGVIVVAPEIIKRLTFLPNIIKQDFAVSLAAQALTWPVIAANFHQVSLIGILVNSLILWTVPLIMVSGIFVIFLTLINFTIASILAIFPGVLLTFFVYIVDFFASFSFSNILINKMSLLVWIGYYILILGFYLSLRIRNKQ